MVDEDDDNDGLFPFQLGYLVADCDCGRIRPASVRCACGYPGHVDEELERRRRLVRVAFDAVVAATPAGTIGDTDPATWFERLSGWIPSFFSACQAIADPDCASADALAATLVEVLAIDADVEATPRYRPHLAVWANVDLAVAAFVDVADAYLRAITCADRTEMEEAAAQGQAALDAFADELHTMAARERKWREITDLAEEGATFDPIIELTEFAYAQSSARTLFDFDAAGQVFVELVTGGVPLSGLGIGFVLTDAQAIAIGDPVRVWSAAKRTFDTVTGRRATLADVVDSPSWRHDYEVLLQELFDAGRELRVSQFQNPRLAARALVRLGHLLAERVGKYLVAAVLAARAGRDYEQLRGFDVGQLLSEAGDVGLGDLALGWDKALRHGDAHRLFEITDDGVRFTAEQREYDFLTWDELGDRVLAGYESVLAVHAGLQCALEQAGIDVVDPLTFLDVDIEDTVRIAMSAHGWTGVVVGVEDGVLDVSGTAPVEPENTSFVAAITPYLPEEIAGARFAITASGGTSLWEGPLEPLRAFAGESDEVAKMIRCIEISARWHVDGAPLFSPAVVRGHMGPQFLAVGEDPTDRLAVVGQLSDLARRLGDSEAVATLADLAAGCRAQRYGREPSRAYHRAALTLAGWYEAAALAA